MSEQKMNGNQHEFNAFEREFFAAYQGELSGVCLSDDAKARLKGKLCQAVVAKAAARAAEEAAAAKDAEVPLHVPAQVLEMPARAAANAAPTMAVTGSQSVAPRRQRRSARRPRTRWAVAAGLVAALLLGGGGTAIASGVISVPLSQAVQDLFGGSVADTKIVDKVGRPAGASATSNGVTVTADAIIGDAANVKIVYTISRDDGKPFDFSGGNYSATSMGFESPGSFIDGTRGMAGGAYFYDADPTDNKVQYVEEWNVDVDGGESLIGKTIHVDLRDLKVYSADEGVSAGDATSGDQSANAANAGKLLAKGEWKLDFKVNYEDAGVSIGEGTKIKQGGMDATIDKATISPVAFTIEYSVNGLLEDSGNAESGQETEERQGALESFCNQDYVFTMKDGSKIEVSNASSSMNRDEVGGREIIKRGFFFDQIIDVDQVASVTVNGTELMAK